MIKINNKVILAIIILVELSMVGCQGGSVNSMKSRKNNYNLLSTSKTFPDLTNKTKVNMPCDVRTFVLQNWWRNFEKGRKSKTPQIYNDLEGITSKYMQYSFNHYYGKWTKDLKKKSF